jgi:hypothetical protein
MSEIRYRGRRAHQIENEILSVVMLVEGGHVAALTHRATGINPLWTPPWPTIEPSAYDPAVHPEYGLGSESRLLAGIHGHNLCLDTFGAPSEAEAAAGADVHGEAGVIPWDIVSDGDTLTATVHVASARLDFARTLKLAGDKLYFTEVLTNLAGEDRPIAWTQHVTLGPPFLEAGQTQFSAPSVRELDLNDDASQHVELSRFTSAAQASGYTAHLMDPSRAHFLAFSPRYQLLLGYVWRPEDFPWLGTWDERLERTIAPWNGITETRGMEFGVSPFPESRQRMIDRGRLFGTPTYRWIGARSSVEVSYYAFLRSASALPGS